MKTSSYLPAKVKKGCERFFDKSLINRLARACGFVRRKVQKISPYHFVVAFLLQCSRGQNTYSGWAREIGLLSGRVVSKQSLWERLHEGTVAFARRLLEAVVVQQVCEGEQGQLFAAFKRVILQDSTTLHLPDTLREVFPGNASHGVQKAVARIQSILEIKRMQFIELSLGAYTQNDQSASSGVLCRVNPGDLLIRDLGYFSLRVFERLIEQQVDFLSRLKYGVKMVDQKGEELALDRWLRKRKKMDRWVYVGSQQKVWVRLILLPLPPHQAAERVRKARRDRDRRLHHDTTYYRWLGYEVFITTVSADTWSPTEVAKAYGVRWQIEMMFKSWKSSFHLQRLLHERCGEVYRVKTTIYLLLLFICLFVQRIYLRYRAAVEHQYGKVVSLLKLSALFFQGMVELLNLSPQKLKKQIALYGCYEPRKDRINMSQLIRSF